MQAPLIDPRSYQQLLDVIRRLQLVRIDPHLHGLIQSLNINRPSNVDLRVWGLLQERVQRLVEQLRDRPFLPANAAVIGTGEYELGTVGGMPFRLTTAELLRHITGAGPSGSGKTTFFSNLLEHVLAGGVHAIVTDYKGDYEKIAATHDDFIILHKDCPVNILDPLPGIDLAEFVNMIVTLTARSYYGGEHLRQIAHKTLHAAYQAQQVPTVREWYDKTKASLSGKHSFQETDAINGLLNRLTRFLEQFPGMTTTRTGIPHDVRWKKSWYLGMMEQNATTDFLVGWLVNSYYLYARQKQLRNQCNYVLLFDEGLLSWGA